MIHLRTLITATTLSALSLSAGAALANGPSVRAAGQVFGVSDKVIAGGTVGFGINRFRFDFDINLGYATDERSQRSLDGGSFFGMIFGFHPGWRVVDNPRLSVDVSSGIDIWWLPAIHEEESKLAMPLIVETSYSLGGALQARLGARYYLISSDGLMVGRAWGGGDSTPVIFTLGLGGEWK
jgi:hypothetical protein